MVYNAGHLFTEGIQDAETNKKLGVWWKTIYLYANIDFLLQKYIFLSPKFEAMPRVTEMNMYVACMYMLYIHMSESINHT